MYARILATKPRNLGRTISWFFAVISLARFIGPFWGAVAYDLGGVNVVAGSCAALLISALFVGFGFLMRSEYSLDSFPQARPVSEQQTPRVTDVSAKLLPDGPKN